MLDITIKPFQNIPNGSYDQLVIHCNISNGSYDQLVIHCNISNGSYDQLVIHCNISNGSYDQLVIHCNISNGSYDQLVIHCNMSVVVKSLSYQILFLFILMYNIHKQYINRNWANRFLIQKLIILMNFFNLYEIRRIIQESHYDDII